MVRLNNPLNNGTTRCKKLATIASGRKYVPRPFVIAKTGKHLCLPDEKSCYVFSIRNNCCDFLASYGVSIQSVV